MKEDEINRLEQQVKDSKAEGSKVAREERSTSTVWLVYLESTLDGKSPKYSKRSIGEYEPGEPSLMLPVGMVLQHSSRNGAEVFDDGFEVWRDWAAYKIYDNGDISRLEGQLLTLAESAISDKEQREAFKSVLRQTLWRFNGDKEREVIEIYKAS